MRLRMLRVWVGLVLGGSGALMYAASWQRWTMWCLSGSGDPLRACAGREDHLYDFLPPVEPWEPVRSSAQLGGLSLLVVALTAVWSWRRSTREPAFDLPQALRVGRIDVRIARDRTLWRIDGGREDPFVPFAHDFTSIGLDGRRNSFAWRDLEFRAVRSRVRFARPQGEVVLRGEDVAASAGMTLGADGHTQGLVPLSLTGAWVFTLGSVDTGAEATTSSAHGHITMFIREDEPFRPQADRIIASLRAFLDDLDRLLAEREARQRDDTEHRSALHV